MSHSKTLLERLQEVEIVLDDGDRAGALDLLVAIREDGFINKDLDRHIKGLRDGHDAEPVAIWIREWIRTQGQPALAAVEEGEFAFEDEDWVDMALDRELGEEIVPDLMRDLGSEISDFSFGSESEIEDMDDEGIDFALLTESEAAADSRHAFDEESATRLVESSASLASEESFNRQEATRMLDRSLAATLAEKDGRSKRASETRPKPAKNSLAGLFDDEEDDVLEGNFNRGAHSLSGKFDMPNPTAVKGRARAGLDALHLDDQSRGEIETAQNPAVKPSSHGGFDSGEITHVSKEEKQQEDSLGEASSHPQERDLTPFRPLQAVSRISGSEQNDAARADGTGSEQRFGMSHSSEPEFETSATSIDADSDDFDFDLGFRNPAESIQTVPTPESDEADDEEQDDFDDFDFDLGLSNPETRNRIVPSERPESTPGKLGPNERETNARLQQPTPISGSPVPLAASASDTHPNDGVVDEEEFFALAESLATESSSGVAEKPYRGEPLVRERPERTPAHETFDASEDEDNPFAHNAPTGVRHAVVESSFVLEEISAASQSGTHANLTSILQEARRLYEAGEFEAALDITNKILARGEHDEAQQLADTIERELERQKIEILGSLSKIPVLAVAPNRIASLDIDHRAGFLISQMDGMMAYEDLLELSAMPRLETLTVLCGLREDGVITDS